MAKQAILIASSNHTQVEYLSGFLEQQGFSPVPVTSLAELDRAVAREGESIVMAILDLTGFAEDLWGRCPLLESRKIPFIALSPQRSVTINEQCTRHGASGILIQPVTGKDLLDMIRSIIVA